MTGPTDEAREHVRANRVDHTRHHVAFARDRADHGRLAGAETATTARAATTVLVVRLATNERFVTGIVDLGDQTIFNLSFAQS